MMGHLVAGEVTRSAVRARSIPPSLAPVLAELELDQPTIVTLGELDVLIRRHDIKTPAKLVAHRLRSYGWLLPTAVPGAYEFAPGAHGGPYGHSDRLVDLKAVVAVHPNLEIAVTGASALAIHGLIDRTPDVLHVAVSNAANAPNVLKNISSITSFQSVLPIEFKRGAPIHSVASVLVLAAQSPGSIGSWGTIGERLSDIVADADREQIRLELAGRSASVRARLAYLIHGADQTLAAEILPIAAPGAPHPIVRFGSRDATRRSNRRFGIVDTLLPFDPAGVPEAMGTA